MTSRDASARSDKPEFPEPESKTGDRTAVTVDATDASPSEKVVVSPTRRVLGPQPDRTCSSQARMSIDGVVGAGERAQTTPFSATARVPAVPSVRIGKSISVGGSQSAGSAVRDVPRGDALVQSSEERARGEQTIYRRRPAQYAVVFAPTSAEPPPPASSRRPLLLAGLAAGLMVASAGYVAVSKDAPSLAPQGVISHTSTPQAAAAEDGTPRMDDVPLPAQPEGVVLDERTQQDPEERVQSYALDLTVEPSDAWIKLDGKSVGVGRVESRLRIDGVEHTLVIGAPGYANRRLKFRDVPPPAHVALDKAVAGSSPSPRRRSVAEAPEEPRRGANGALILR